MSDMSKTITFGPTESEELFLNEASKLLGTQGKSQVIHILLKKGYETLTQSESQKSFEDSGFIGCGSVDDPSIAGNHKKHISQIISQKWS
jgi:hypothetical protein